MFFHVNWLHDRWYEAWFDEASGNAQQDNFGLGGIGGDPILAEGNDFSGRTMPICRRRPTVQPPHADVPFRRPNPLPSRTSNHEALITFHEMGHYITNRLVGNASGLMNAQGRAMGEGWGDFFAVCMTSQATDDFASGTFAVGGWTDVTPTFKENYYYSIRRYPYSADMTKRPLTFKHISANVLLPVGPQRNPNGGEGNQEAHNADEIWSCALWECFINLVAAHGHAEAEPRMLRYVIGGLKLTRQTRHSCKRGTASCRPRPRWSRPTFGALEGFAKRGMGKDAVTPAATSVNLTGVVEASTSLERPQRTEERGMEPVKLATRPLPTEVADRLPAASRGARVALGDAPWLRFGDDLVYLGQERHWAGLTAAASRAGIVLREHPGLIDRSRLHVIIQRAGFSSASIPTLGYWSTKAAICWWTWTRAWPGTS
jgi:hypothetical protein